MCPVYDTKLNIIIKYAVSLICWAESNNIKYKIQQNDILGLDVNNKDNTDPIQNLILL